VCGAPSCRHRILGIVANNNKNPKAAAKPAEEVTRLQRLLGVVGLSLLVFGILALVALLIGESLTPIAISNDSGIWSIVAFIPDIAIPVGFALLIALIIITFRRRAQAAQGAGK
jgi:TRAP-type C4-dicarboxylate transport system permease small subunit